ncbi:hypothetical protein ACLBX9_12860 [Methylobacterium sp. A49B]
MDVVHSVMITVFVSVAILPITVFLYLLTRPRRRQVGYTYGGGGDVSWNSNPSSPDSSTYGGHSCSHGGSSSDGGSCGGGDGGGGGGGD